MVNKLCSIAEAQLKRQALNVRKQTKNDSNTPYGHNQSASLKMLLTSEKLRSTLNFLGLLWVGKRSKMREQKCCSLIRPYWILMKVSYRINYAVEMLIQNLETQQPQAQH